MSDIEARLERLEKTMESVVQRRISMGDAEKIWKERKPAPSLKCPVCGNDDTWKMEWRTGYYRECKYSLTPGAEVNYKPGKQIAMRKIPSKREIVCVNDSIWSAGCWVICNTVIWTEEVKP